MKISFVVPGEPQALKRHRTFRRGANIGSYDPSKGDKADFLAKALAARPASPIDGVPIDLKVTAIFSRPKSHYGTGKNSKKLKAYADVYHTKKPDADNVLKFVKDALNGVFWRDDCLVARATITKLYAQDPQVLVSVETIDREEF